MGRFTIVSSGLLFTDEFVSHLRPTRGANSACACALYFSNDRDRGRALPGFPALPCARWIFADDAKAVSRAAKGVSGAFAPIVRRECFVHGYLNIADLGPNTSPV